jgi:hypothetical protein
VNNDDVSPIFGFYNPNLMITSLFSLCGNV